MNINSKGELVVNHREEVCDYINHSWKKSFEQLYTLYAAKHITENTYLKANKILADYILSIDFRVADSQAFIIPCTTKDVEQTVNKSLLYDVLVTIVENYAPEYTEQGNPLVFRFTAEKSVTSPSYFEQKRNKAIMIDRGF